MSLKLKIKVGNITNLSDARYSAGMGVHWLGFRISNINPQTFREITGWVTGPQFVVEIQVPDDLKRVDDYAPESIEIPVELLNNLASESYSLIVRLPVAEFNSNRETLLKHKNRIQCLVLTEGTGQQHHDQKILSEASQHFEVIVGYNVNPETLHQWKDIHGFNLEGSQELKPGLKDYQALAEILEQLEVD